MEGCVKHVQDESELYDRLDILDDLLEQGAFKSKEEIEQMKKELAEVTKQIKITEQEAYQTLFRWRDNLEFGGKIDKELWDDEFR